MRHAENATPRPRPRPKCESSSNRPKAKDPDDGRVYEGIGERPGPSVERDPRRPLAQIRIKQSKRFVPYWKSWGRCQTENAELKCKANADGGCRPQQHGGTQDLRCGTWGRNLDLASLSARSPTRASAPICEVSSAMIWNCSESCEPRACVDRVVQFAASYCWIDLCLFVCLFEKMYWLLFVKSNT